MLCAAQALANPSNPSSHRFSLRVGPPLLPGAKSEIADLLSTRFGGQVVRVNFIEKYKRDGEDESHVYVTFSELDACHAAVQTLRSVRTLPYHIPNAVHSLAFTSHQIQSDSSRHGLRCAAFLWFRSCVM